VRTRGGATFIRDGLTGHAGEAVAHLADRRVHLTGGVALTWTP